MIAAIQKHKIKLTAEEWERLFVGNEKSLICWHNGDARPCELCRIRIEEFNRS